MTNIDWPLVPGSVLCTVHLMLGLIVGYAACHFAKSDPPHQPASGADVRQFKSAMDGLLTQVRQLSSLSESHSGALPPSFLEAIAKLLESISSLHNQANGRAVAFRKAAVLSVNHAQPKEHEPPILTGRLYEELTKGEAMSTAGEDPVFVRRAYEVPQYMAPWKGTLPRGSQYQEVQCNDLSAGGISFFTRELPAGRFIMITLGLEHELLMQAEILHHQRRQRDRTFLYLVGCRFTKRFEDVPDECKPVTFKMID